MVTCLSASATPGDDVSDTDRHQQQRDRAKQQPRKPIGQSFAAAQSPTMLPHPDCVHRPYFRLDVRLKKGSEDLERVELEQRQKEQTPPIPASPASAAAAPDRKMKPKKIIMTAKRPDLLR
jgi:hypothetical protein